MSQPRQYFYHQQHAKTHPDARNTEIQDALLEACARATGVRLPHESKPGTGDAKG
jgi:hypothetical protein